MTLKTILLRIEISYPAPELSPNRKAGAHWAKTVKIKDSYFNDAFYATKQTLGGIKIPEQDLHLHITFYQKDKRHRDMDNLLAASKPALDGLSKALGIDDRHFQPITIDRGYSKQDAFTLIEITCNLS